MTFTFESLNLSELVREVVRRFSDHLAQVGNVLTLELEDGVIGHVDPTRIEQTLDNLLTNVIKYAPATTVTVSLSRNGQLATLIVHDGGPGVPHDRQAVIFERFERGVPASSVSGLGLGLFIVREIVNGHGGSIELDSRPGYGTRFTVTLPLSERPAPERAVL
jgi:signal transduction histidine kinase